MEAESGEPSGSHQHRPRDLWRQAVYSRHAHLGVVRSRSAGCGGMPEAELRDEYPQLIHEDVLAAIAYGAEASRERVIPVSVEPAA
jgi:hypothetical protein